MTFNPARVGRTRTKILEALLDGQVISPKAFADAHNLTANRVCQVLKDLLRDDAVKREDKTTGPGGRRVVFKACNRAYLAACLKEQFPPSSNDDCFQELLNVWR